MYKYIYIQRERERERMEKGKKKKTERIGDCVIYRSGNNDFQLSAALGSLSRFIGAGPH
jgi:hypothetical protein